MSVFIRSAFSSRINSGCRNAFHLLKFIRRTPLIFMVYVAVLLGSSGSVYAIDVEDKSQFGGRIGMSDSPKFIYELQRPGAQNWTLPLKHAYLVGETISIVFWVDNFARDRNGRVNVTSGFEFLKPDESVMFPDKKYSIVSGKPVESSTWGLLDPALDIGFDNTDTPGTHILRVTLTDHVSGQTVTIQEPISW